MGAYECRNFGLDTGSIRADFECTRKLTIVEQIALSTGDSDDEISREEMLAWAERVERGETPLSDWNCPYSFDEFVRRLRAGENLIYGV